MTRLIRKIVATWYDSLDEEGFEVGIQIPEKQLFWDIDENWFQRMIDNVIQNVVRHASIGIYIDYEGEIITTVDRGSGFQNTPSKNKGACLVLPLWRKRCESSGVSNLIIQGLHFDLRSNNKKDRAYGGFSIYKEDKDWFYLL
ncbi:MULTISPECIES: hypothetical protein [Bacillus cereus group]|uniref:hypothetical protein n=1 Tax=Bacillus cereus group TaxID=86661 RepID=UPI001F5AB12F|nr:MULTISPECIES: hypothetical protein [Bacillus cereus group]MDH2887069.1 hypothetical protein [Bacillus cytotoxicus]